MSGVKWWRKAGAWALDLLFPRRCPFCRRLLEGEERLLCGRCQRELPWIPGEQSLRGGEFFTACAAPLWYQDAVRKSHHRYKFGGLRSYAAPYAALTAQCVGDHLRGQFDVIAWVPLSKKRLRKRGYDQARLLAERMAPLLGVSAERLLDKPRDTGAQSALSGEATRRANVLGAYALAPGAEAEGRRILLIDDVMTTGATLSECARVLKSAGASQVCCAVLAHTPRQKS